VKLSLHATDLVVRLRQRSGFGDEEAVGLLTLVCGFSYMLPFMVWGLYDRYVNLLILCVAAGLLGFSGRVEEARTRPRKTAWIVAFSLMACWAFVSVSGTRDYLMWNRVRWQALRDLMESAHADPSQIDGGFEFNGLYLFDPNYKADPPSVTSRSSWWVKQDTYEVGFGPVPKFSVIREYDYRHWFPPHQQKIVVMRRMLPPEALARPLQAAPAK